MFLFPSQKVEGMSKSARDGCWNSPACGQAGWTGTSLARHWGHLSCGLSLADAVAVGFLPPRALCPLGVSSRSPRVLCSFLSFLNGRVQRRARPDLDLQFPAMLMASLLRPGFLSFGATTLSLHKILRILSKYMITFSIFSHIQAGVLIFHPDGMNFFK